ncbi:MAG: hypothetical protein ACTHWQ_02865, partial [Sphingobacterium sp.]
DDRLLSGFQSKEHDGLSYWLFTEMLYASEVSDIVIINFYNYVNDKKTDHQAAPAELQSASFVSMSTA